MGNPQTATAITQRLWTAARSRFSRNLNGIFYVQRTGCQWEMLPHDLPPYSTVYGYFEKWQRKGIWQQMHDQIRHQLRSKLGHDEYSSVAIADFQSVKTTEKRG